jgi:peroxiredoxin Q/BCP
MAQLRQDFAEFEKRKTTILVVGPDNAAAFSKYWQENKLPFIGLPDPSHTVLKVYGQQINLFKFGRMPAQVLVDMNGIARFVHYGHDMTDIPKNAEMLALIDSLKSG